MLGIPALIDHAFSWPTPWLFFEIFWLSALGGYGYYLFRKEGWFQKPITFPSMFWQVPFFVGISAIMTTEFQVEGAFLFLKYHYIKELMKQDKGTRYFFLVILSAVAFVLLVLL